MIGKSKLAVALGSILFTGIANASTHAVDARSMAMGNTGVASSDYLTAAFHNPALVASYEDEDDIGILIPAIAATANDPDDTLELIDDAELAYDNNDVVELERFLSDLDDNRPLNVTAAMGISVAIPNNMLSASLFTGGYVELIAIPDVTSTGNLSDYEDSKVNLAGFGYAEVGIALAKLFVIEGQRFSLGVSPKFQDIRTYADIMTLEDFDLDDYDESEQSESAFNIDVGAVWHLGSYQVGVVGKNLLEQEIDAVLTNGHKVETYTLSPIFSVGFAYRSEYFTAAIDADLTAQERFDVKGDETQFIRFGVEGDAWGWAQLRAGYEVDMENNLENSITAGLGISPFEVVSLDLAASYAGENQVGVSGNLAFTF
jgi:hypothetical protein